MNKKQQISLEEVQKYLDFKSMINKLELSEIEIITKEGAILKVPQKFLGEWKYDVGVSNMLFFELKLWENSDIINEEVDQ